MIIPKALQTWIINRIKSAAASIRTIAKSGRPVELAGRAGAADEPDYQDQGLLMQHYGFRSRPGAGAELVTLAHLAAATQRLAVASEAPGTGPTDQEDWEVEIYAKAGQRIRLRADGSMVLSVTGGAQAQLLPSGSVVLTDGSGGTATLAAGRLTASTELAAQHYYGTGSQPTATVISTNVTTAVVSAGTDSCCVLLLTVGPNPSVGPLCIVTYAAAWPTTPIAYAVQNGSAEKISISSTPTGMTLSCPSLPVGSYELTLVSVGVA